MNDIAEESLLVVVVASDIASDDDRDEGEVLDGVGVGFDVEGLVGNEFEGG